MLNTMTPEQLLTMYAPLVEGSEQAFPMLVVEFENRRLAVLVLADVSEETGGIQGTLVAARRMLMEQERFPVAAALSSEAWVRVADEPESEERSEAVLIVYVDRSGTSWSAMQPFSRTVFGVAWSADGIDVNDEASGGAMDRLAELVSAP